MDTTTAASQAGVTVDTIRYWCRYGAVAAVKKAGRWVIDAASLAHRICLGKEHRTVTDAPLLLTTRTTTRGPGIVGPSHILRTAYETNRPVTIAKGKFAGERVYLGITRQTFDDGIRLERKGLDRELGESPKHPGVQVAIYLIDTDRVDQAPRFAEAVRVDQARRATAAMRAEAAEHAEDDRRERDGAH